MLKQKPQSFFKVFEKAYLAWLRECLLEFNERFQEERLYFCFPDKFPSDYNPGQLVEFAEDGDAYPHGAGGTGHIKCAVTPWAESPHFME